MQFYKYEGFTTDETWSDENENRRVMRERVRRISMKSKSFNQKLKKKAFFCVTNASEDTITVCIICNDSSKLDRLLSAYMSAIEIELTDTYLEEVTFKTAKNMLELADRHDYIDDDDEVLEQFDLDKLNSGYGRRIRFDEDIIEDISKKDVYKEAEKYLMRGSFVPELDRIYAGAQKETVMGHPVHYMIQTDDFDTRENVSHLLLKALYENRRIRSRRYSYLSFKSGEDFSTTVYNCLYKSCIGGAVIVNYLSNDDPEDDHASSGRETIENLCEIMKKYRNQVLTIFCLPGECTKAKEIFYENLGNTSFVELKEELVSGERAEHFLKMLAKGNRISADKNLFKKLEPDKGYLTPELHDLFDEWYNNKLKTGVYPQYKELATAKHEVTKSTPKGSAYDELMEMIGLEEAKAVINRALNYYKAQKLFADKGMKTERTAMHMVFTGNPGTAKTSVARLFAGIMKENGLLSKGQLIEVGRGDLVGKYVGWTAPIIQKKFREAEGGVLFIDEAYSLVDDRDGSYGDEAINTIVQEMENHRDDVVVIFAGYPDKMEGFLSKNPGLRSRIAFHVPFADYNTEDLCDIANLIARRKGLKLTEDACEKLSSIFDMVRTESDFGNGRYVRNTIEKAKMAQATRLLSMDYDAIGKNDISTICADDIETPVILPKQVRHQIGFGI